MNSNFKVPYVTFMKHAQKVTKAVSKSRPVLGGVHHKDGYLAATDTHRLYFASGMHEGNEKIIDPASGVEITAGAYPDVLRLIPNVHDATFSTILDVERTLKVIKVIEAAGKIDKASDLIVFDMLEGDLSLDTCPKSKVSVRYVVAQDTRHEDFKMSANVKYLAEAFAFMKEAGLNEVQFNYYSETRPFTFTAGNLTALILPVRVY